MYVLNEDVMLGACMTGMWGIVNVTVFDDQVGWWW